MIRRFCHFTFVILWFTPFVARAQPTDDAEVEKSQLTVATRHVPPFAIRDEEGHWSGIAIGLLQSIVADYEEANNLAIEIEYRDMQLGEMIDATAAGEVDMAVAALTINYEREKVLDFSHPFHRSGLGIAVSAKQTSGWFSVLDRIVSVRFLKLLGGLGAMLIVSGMLVYWFERKANPEQFGGGIMHGLGAGIWWSIVTLTTVGYGDKAPSTVSGRAIAVL